VKQSTSLMTAPVWSGPQAVAVRYYATTRISYTEVRGTATTQRLAGVDACAWEENRRADAGVVVFRGDGGKQMRYCDRDSREVGGGRERLAAPFIAGRRCRSIAVAGAGPSRACREDDELTHAERYAKRSPSKLIDTKHVHPTLQPYRTPRSRPCNFRFVLDLYLYVVLRLTRYEERSAIS
jgi:hypothetical protein